MPITDPEVRLKFRQAGHDPDLFDDPIEESSSPQSVVEPTPEVSKVATFVRTFARELPSTAVGLAAGAKTGAMLAPAGPAIAIPGSIIAGLGAGIASRYGQEKLVEQLPENISKPYFEQQRQDLEVNPKTALAAGILSSAPFMKPSVGVLKEAGRAAINPLRSVRPTSTQIEALANVGLGGTIPVATTIGQELYTEGNLDNVSPSRLLAEFVGGALLNQPTKIGQKLGLKPINVDNNRVDVAEARIKSSPIEGTREQAQVITPIEPEIVGPTEAALLKPSTEVEALKAIDEEIKNKAKEQKLQEKVNKIEEQKVKQAAKDAEAYQAEDLVVAKFFNLPEESFTKFPEEAKGAFRNKYKEAQELIAGTKEPIATKAELIGKPKAIPVEEPLPKNELDIVIKPQSDTSTTDETLPFNPDEQWRAFQEEPVKLKLKDDSIPDTDVPTQAYANYFKKLGGLRNIEVNDEGKVFSGGKEISGQTVIRQGVEEVLAKINPDKAKVDTYPHELLHNFWRDLRKFGSEGDRNIVSKGSEVIKNSTAFKEWSDGLSDNSSYKKLSPELQVEEFIARNGGVDVVRRMLKTDGKGEFRNFLSDFWSASKHRFGKASDEDYARLMGIKLIADAPFKELPGIQPKATPIVDENNSETIAEQDTPEGKKLTEEIRKKLLARSAEEDPAIKKQLLKEAQELIKQLDKIEPPKDANQEESALPSRKSINVLRSDVKRLTEIGPEGEKMAKGYSSFEDKYSSNRGEFVNKHQNAVRQHIGLGSLIESIVKHPSDYWRQDTPELQNAVRWLYDKSHGLSTKASKPSEELLKIHGDTVEGVRKELQNRPGIREEVVGSNRFYFPEMPDPRVLRKVFNEPNSPESKQLIKEFIKHNADNKFNGDVEKAKEAFEKFKNGYNNKNVNLAEQFGPLDKPEGIGLPWSWVNKNYLDVMNRYGDRVSRRFAYHDTIETQKELSDVFNTYRANELTKKIIGDMTGNKTFENPKLNALYGVVRSLNLQTLTGAVDFVSSPFLTFQHFSDPTQPVRAMVDSWKNFKENLTDAWETGRLRRHMNSLEMDNGIEDIYSHIRRFRDVVSDVTGRNWFEQMARAQTMGMGKWGTMNYFNEHLNGKLSKAGKKWFEDFGGDIKWQEKSELTANDIKQIAARFVDANQGTYDGRGLPRWSMEGWLAPHFSIARWSIEKSNNFLKYSIEPATKGNFQPLLMSLVGAILGGAAVNELREIVTQRKQKTPTIAELESIPSKMGMFYKYAGLMSAAGHSGMLGDLVKSGLDVTYGKNKPQTINNILIETAINTGNTFVNFANAVAEQGMSEELIGEFIGTLLQDNIQTYRILAPYAFAESKEDIERANKLRDLRVFNTLSGDKIVDLRTSFKEDFDDLALKKFKKTSDIEEAKKLLPELIQDAIVNADGDEEKLKKALTRIKSNSYPTMPNPQRWPESFRKYILHLSKTQGAEVAQKRVIDYITRNEINKAKSDLVP